MCIGGQFASASARRGALRLFRAFELLLKDGQNGFFSNAGILLLVFLVSSIAVKATKAPPPTNALHASPTDTLIDEFRFLRDDGGRSER